MPIIEITLPVTARGNDPADHVDDAAYGAEVKRRMSAATLSAVETDNGKSRLRKSPVDFDAYMQAREDDVGRIKEAPSFRAELIDEFHGDSESKGAKLPWDRTHERWRLRRGETTIWTGFNGHCKSMVTGYVALGLMRQDEKVCIASFEMKPRKTLRRLASQSIGVQVPTEVYIDKFLDSLVNRLWLYDQQGETTPDRVLGVIYYCAEQLGVTHFVIDSMMKVVANEDDYNGQKKFISRLCAAAKDLNIHIHLVHHSRKRDDEKTRPGKQDAKGTGAIVDQTDNFVTVFKVPKREGEDDKPDFFLFLDKQRHGEWEGSVPLWLVPGSLQFHDQQTTRSVRFIA
jgi:twinkle protein